MDHIPPSRLRALARHGAAARAQTIARMAPERRVATLLAFARAFEIIAMDDALDLLDFLISQFVLEARNEGERRRLRTLRDLDAAALQLWHALGVLLDETVAAAAVRTQTYDRFPRERLLEAVFSCKNSGGTARYPAKTNSTRYLVTLPRIRTATNINWHYVTQWHILKNTSSIAP